MRRATALLALSVLALLLAPSTDAEWSAKPGETKRNAFGPLRGDQASVCRGACGAGCPDTCAEQVAYECTDPTSLRRVTTYECGTHRACRRHDDCLDACSQHGLDKLECQTRCHQEAVEIFGFEDATSWAGGYGPYDGPPITFEYTREGPTGPEPVFRCPQGASLACEGITGRCVAAGGSTVEPVFDSYSVGSGGGMSISGFRAGRMCGGRVCEQTADIRVTGADSCAQSGGAASCTRFGLEFDYQNADPAEPLECRASTSGGKKDFIGDLIAKGLEAMPEKENASGEEGHGMRELLGVFKKVVSSANSPEDVRISTAPLGPDGKPIESQRVGTPADAGPQSIPRIVDIATPNGHLVVPMYQFVDGTQTGPLVHEIRCSHKGVPVVETTFRLTF